MKDIIDIVQSVALVLLSIWSVLTTSRVSELSTELEILRKLPRNRTQ